jgi:glycine/D-amino acid oxidase-like deaminating enzyme
MPATLHPDALQFDREVPSYWEESAAPLGLALKPLAGEALADVAIIGAGYTGLSAALELRELYGLDVHVLEAGVPGWGASGRNGGFACIGSHKLSYDKMIAIYGLEATQGFYRLMKDAVAQVQENCRSYGIDAALNDGGEITLAHRTNRIDELKAERDFLQTHFNETTTLLDRQHLRERGMFGPRFHGGLLGTTGFGLHPLDYVRGLARAAVQAGAVISPHSRVIRWEERDGFHVLSTAEGALKAKRVIVATNGYTPEDVSTYHRGRLLPALSNIITTRPFSEAERQEQGWASPTMAYDTRNLLHYFRLLPDGRFLFGGRGGTDGAEASRHQMRDFLIKRLKHLFPVFGSAEITHFWRGYVCLSYDLVPYVGPLDERKTVFTSIAYHGNGVAMASHCGRLVAKLMMSGPQAADLPAVVTRRLQRFPLPLLRPLYLKGAYLWFKYQDRR